MTALVYRLYAYLLVAVITGGATWHAVSFWPRHALTWGSGLLAFLGVVGAIALLGRSERSSGNGLRTHALSSVWAMDAICLIGAAMAGFFIVDGFTDRLGGLPSLFNEPLAADVIAFMFLPASAVMAAVVAQSASQVVSLDSDGLRVSRLGGTDQASWDKVCDLTLKDQYVLVGRLGFLIPRKLRTNLVVKLSGDHSISIVDPGTSRSRQRLLNAFERHVPFDLKDAVHRARADWT